MESGGHPHCGVCAAVDVHYLPTGGARAAAVLAADTAFARVLAEHTAVLPQVPPYQPGQFYLRELPPLSAVLENLSGLGLLVVDGYAHLDPSGRPDSDLSRRPCARRSRAPGAPPPVAPVVSRLLGPRRRACRGGRVASPGRSRLAATNRPPQNRCQHQR